MNDVERAKAHAAMLVVKLGLKAPPVPVERLAKSLGVKVEYSPFDDELSGMAFLRGGQPIIGVNSNHHPNRQRFTIAHELGHVCLHRRELEAAVLIDKRFLPRDSVSAEGTNHLERQANAFAAELLMPTNLLSGVLSRTLDLEDDKRLIGLAKVFRVSLMALQYRLQSQW
jgi:Zn-dependent peptidase ImmA (M78 family)